MSRHEAESAAWKTGGHCRPMSIFTDWEGEENGAHPPESTADLDAVAFLVLTLRKNGKKKVTGIVTSSADLGTTLKQPRKLLMSDHKLSTRGRPSQQS